MVPIEPTGHDPQIIGLMTRAFDGAWDQLQKRGLIYRPEVKVRERVSTIIIAAIDDGERDIDALIRRVLKVFDPLDIC
jgi:hypothetical protein